MRLFKQKNEYERCQRISVEVNFKIPYGRGQRFGSNFESEKKIMGFFRRVH